MHVSVFRVDAFTDTIFAGNPAAVCPLAHWPEDELLRAIAAENNLSETAYLVPQGDDYALRWFTPRCEVNLCGHATLASGFVVLNILEPKRQSVRFGTRSGTLSVSRESELLSMDFPSLPTWACPDPGPALIRSLDSSGDPAAARQVGGGRQVAVRQVKDIYFVVYESEEEVRGIAPNFALLEKLHPFAVA